MTCLKRYEQLSDQLEKPILMKKYPDLQGNKYTFLIKIRPLSIPGNK